MIVAGLGFTSKASAADIVRAVRSTVAAHKLTLGDIDCLASGELKRDSQALAEAADLLGVKLFFPQQDALETAAQRGQTRSSISLAATGLPSLSEAAALAGAGEDSHLLAPRKCHGPVTCALAITASDEADTSPQSCSNHNNN